MKKILVTSCVVFIVSMAAIAQKVRPKEAWVFRSVLDKKARVITVALNKDLFVAYDGNNCGIFKIWKEGVSYSGTIWDTKHGPQPSSKGKAYSEGSDEPVWILAKDGVELRTKAQFKGYRWKNNTITFMYELSTENGIKVTVEETPEYVLNPKDNTIGLERKLKIDAVPAGYSVISIIKYDNLIKKEDFVTDGTLKMISRNEQYFDWGTTYDFKGKLTLKPAAITSITAYYSPKVIQ